MNLASSASDIWQVSQSLDDVYRQASSGQWQTVLWIETGWYDATYHGTESGFRFLSIGIPQGATIISAYFSGRARSSESAAVVRSRIQGHDIDDSPIFSTEADFIARDKTSAVVDWDGIPTFIAGTWYDSPEIKTIIQEIVDREGWESGNDLALFWEDSEDRSDHAQSRHRQFNSWDEDPDWAIKLMVEWELPLSNVTFYYSDDGQFLYNGTVASNGTVVAVEDGEVLRLVGASDADRVFERFDLNGVDELTNNYNYTVSGDATLFCYFGEGYIFEFEDILEIELDMTLTIFLIAMIIFFCGMVGATFFPIVGLSGVIIGLVTFNYLPADEFTIILFSSIEVLCIFSTLTGYYLDKKRGKK